MAKYGKGTYVGVGVVLVAGMAVAGLLSDDQSVAGESFHAIATLPENAVHAMLPNITMNSRRSHEDRGPCTTCHAVIDLNGRHIPYISAMSLMPHQYRGNCTNCHEVSGVLRAPSHQINNTLRPPPNAPATAPPPGIPGPMLPVA